MTSRRPRPTIRVGHESFRYRSVILDEDGSASTLSARVSEFSSLVSVDEHRVLSSSAATHPSSRHTIASHPPSRDAAPSRLKRLHRAASTSVVTNDLKPMYHSDEEIESDGIVCSIGRSYFSIKDEVEMPIETPLSKPTSSVKCITEHERNAGAYTIIAFVNSISGGGMGNTIYKSLQRHLGLSHVIDLHSCRPGNMPEDSLLKYAYDPMVRVLACGGDGTCGWIFSSLDKVWSTVLGQTSTKCCIHLSKYKDHLPLAIMPLGTGNDLSRQFRWGKHFHSHMEKTSMVSAVQRSKIRSLDRWRCIMMPVETLADEEKQFIPKILGEHHHDVEYSEQAEEDYSNRGTVDLLHSLLDEEDFPELKRSKKQMNMSEPSTQVFDGVFCNYFSLGFDATIAYLFHHEREMHPEKFTSPFRNKLVYVQKSPYALKAPKLRKRVKVLINNEKGQLVKLKIPKSCRAIVLMNIQSFAGGNRLTSKGDPTDGLIEVIFVSNLIRAVSCTMSSVMPFLHFKVAAQTNNVCIRTGCPLHCQVDGEPWLQGEGIIQVKFHSRNPILEKAKDANCGCMGGTDQTVIN
mmetsp:Transcript_6190/g.14022  ORF Transcript_6190/g.14022 Transcript_6190/m.14022 type:complete len:574 (+) Transcript_6190:123-1844(+)|eukprot:CAMPEP_0172304942 /NCGR_PEP_ID=MMETSP1058-20130122/6284_1 /TAXON_ID=83371 /ORGANISM="Detonula confervacea, Strain CCMP 353" /LENGTH=573 /DNA_ID=CAMNT_0013016349 /DNA_START=26 /DNA_END=1747 /DNA_ORIENTATION=+